MKRAILSLALLLCVGSCSHSTKPKPVIPNPVLYNNVVMMDEQPFQLLPVSGGIYSFLVTGVPSRVPVPGDIIVGTPTLMAPAGYLRKVTAVTASSPTSLVLTTMEAKLTDAVKEWTVDKTIPLGIDIPNGYLAPGISVQDNGLALKGINLFNGTVGGIHISATIDTGYIKLIDPTYRFGLVIRDSTVEEFHSVADTKIKLSADLHLSAAGQLANVQKEARVYEDRKTTVAPAFFPVVHEITTTVDVGFKFEASGGVDYRIQGLQSEMAASAGVQYSNETWTDVSKVTVIVAYGTPTWDAWLRATVTPYVLFRVEDKFYGIAGPNVWVKPYLRCLGTSRFNDGSWRYCVNVSGGIDMGVGVAVGILDSDLASWDSPPLLSPSADLYEFCDGAPW